MEYTIKAIETRFNGFVFRSRLEAKWAAMFELLGWNWDYEPVDFNGWIPDFVIYGDQPIYVEVKPVIDFPSDVAKKLECSGCKDEMLIIGQKCLLIEDYNESSFESGLYFGWVADRIFNQEGNADHWWAPATFGRWNDGKGKIGFCHSEGGYNDRITGGYDGGIYGGHSDVNGQEIKGLWSSAHNATRWMKVR